MDKEFWTFLRVAGYRTFWFVISSSLGMSVIFTSSVIVRAVRG